MVLWWLSLHPLYCTVFSENWTHTTYYNHKNIIDAHYHSCRYVYIYPYTTGGGEIGTTSRRVFMTNLGAPTDKTWGYLHYSVPSLDSSWLTSPVPSCGLPVPELPSTRTHTHTQASLCYGPSLWRARLRPPHWFLICSTSQWWGVGRRGESFIPCGRQRLRTWTPFPSRFLQTPPPDVCLTHTGLKL